MASTTLVSPTVPPKWAPSEGMAAGADEEGKATTVENRVKATTTANCRNMLDPHVPSQQYPQMLLQANTNYFLSYDDTGLPALFPSCGTAGCTSQPTVSAASAYTMMPSPTCAAPSFSSLYYPFPYISPFALNGDKTTMIGAGWWGKNDYSNFLHGVSSSDPMSQWWEGKASIQHKRNSGVSTGTTIVAVTFKGGVVLGADTRTSAGSYVVNRAARKITPIHEKICVCRSGSAADTQALTQIVKYYLQQYAQELPRRSNVGERRKYLQRVAAATKQAQQRQREAEEQEKKDSTAKKTEGKEEGASAQQHIKRREDAAPEEEEEGENERERGSGTQKTSEEEREKGKGKKAAAERTSGSGSEGRRRERQSEEKDEDDSDFSEEDAEFLTEDARSEPRVRTAATLFQSLCYEYKDTLTAGLIVAGYDAVEGSQIYSIPLGGALMPMKCTAGGSGSGYITAFMDSEYYPGMDKATAVDFVKRSVAHAISRDGSSGGMIRIIVVTKHGLEEECVEGNRLPVRP